mgnify:CR=1 FL=1|tara:strand:- start:576 stop:734 length:159 start_codon:yes stop_codon:yes gene_type:complete
MINFLKDMALARWICSDAFEDNLDWTWQFISAVIMLMFAYVIVATVWSVNFS